MVVIIKKKRDMHTYRYMLVNKKLGGDTISLENNIQDISKDFDFTDIQYFIKNYYM